MGKPEPTTPDTDEDRDVEEATTPDTPEAPTEDRQEAKEERVEVSSLQTQVDELRAQLEAREDELKETKEALEQATSELAAAKAKAETEAVLDAAGLPRELAKWLPTDEAERGAAIEYFAAHMAPTQPKGEKETAAPTHSTDRVPTPVDPNKPAPPTRADLAGEVFGALDNH